MKKFLLGLVAGLLLAGMTVLIVAFAMVRLGDKRPSVPNAATLVLELGGDIPERPEVELPFFPSDGGVTMYETWNVLRKAAVDQRIKAVLLMPRHPQLGWAKLNELRGGLMAVRQAGKPVYAWLYSPNTRDYYLASAAEKVYIAPEDFLEVKGLRAELMFVKGTLDKLGVKAEIEHAGKYKDAADMLTRTGATPETKEVINSVLDEIYGDVVSAISQGRKKPVEEIRAAIDAGPLLPKDAQARGLVDGLLYKDQTEGELMKKLGQSELKRISLSDYARVPASSLGLEGGNTRIAVVVGEGAIYRGDSRTDPFGSPQGIASESFIKLLHQVGKDNAVKAVLVRIDSPGGDAMASDDILREMKLLGQKKPLVVSMSDVAASGGYYMALTGDPIVAYPGSVTGSIGVIYGKMNLRGLYDKVGITKEIMARGKFASIDSEYEPLSDEGRKKLREGIDHIYTGFVKRVAEARKRKYEEIEPHAQGRAWLGSQAKRNGLIDELGGFDKALEVLRKKANIGKDEKVRIVMYPPRKSFFEAWMSREMESDLGAEVRQLLGGFDWRVWVPGGMMRIAPYRLEIR